MFNTLCVWCTPRQRVRLSYTLLSYPILCSLTTATALYY